MSYYGISLIHMMITFSLQRLYQFSLSRSTCAVAGDNFAVIATDTRMSQFEINVMSRDAEKIHIL